VHLHQQIAGNPDAYTYAYTYANADADAHTYADAHADVDAHAHAHAHTYAYAHAHTGTHAAGDTGRAAYSGTSYAHADGGSCHGHASAATGDRRQWRKAVGHGLACVGLVGRCYGLDAGRHG
jgi:hypothetical protein